MRAALLIGGAVIEFGGIVLVGSPDLIPYAQRLSAWLTPKFWRIVNPILRSIGRPRHVVVNVGTAGSVAVAGSVSALVTVNANATLEEKVEFLLRRSTEAQQALNSLGERLNGLERETRQELREARDHTETYVSKALAAAHETYLTLRIIGVAALLLGLGLATAGNFVDR